MCAAGDSPATAWNRPRNRPYFPCQLCSKLPFESGPPETGDRLGHTTSQTPTSGATPSQRVPNLRVPRAAPHGLALVEGRINGGPSYQPQSAGNAANFSAIAEHWGAPSPHATVAHQNTSTSRVRCGRTRAFSGTAKRSRRHHRQRQHLRPPTWPSSAVRCAHPWFSMRSKTVRGTDRAFFPGPICATEWPRFRDVDTFPVC